MSIKVFQVNSNGKVEFTRNELEKLLNEVYQEGLREGEEKAKHNYWTWTSPSIRGPIYCKDGLNNAATTITTNAVDGTMPYNTNGIEKRADRLSELVDKILENSFGPAVTTTTETARAEINSNPVYTNLAKEVRGL